MAGTLNLRGHHLLCVFGFRGLGYSPAFVTNMRRVVQVFFSPEVVEIEVTARPDVICSGCPHLREGACKGRDGAEERVRAKDARVLARLGLQAGDRRSSAVLAALIAERIEPCMLPEICSGCRWLPAGYCQEGLRQHRRQD